jgi:hypothetical protein
MGCSVLLLLGCEVVKLSSRLPADTIKHTRLLTSEFISSERILEIVPNVQYVICLLSEHLNGRFLGRDAIVY